MRSLNVGRSLILLTSIAVLTGCGGSEKGSSSGAKAPAAVSTDQRSVLAAVGALEQASRQGDGNAICANLFTAKLVKSIEAAANRSCGREVKERLFSADAALSVSRTITVTRNRSSAIVREANGDVSRLSFVKRNAGWRISGIEAERSG
jgi:hypothetical protein